MILVCLFIFSKRVEASVVCETDGQKETRTDLDRFLYWPILTNNLHKRNTRRSYIDHSMLCYLQDPLSTSFCFSVMVAQLEVAAPSGALSLSAWLSLSPSLFPTATDSTAAGIWIYYFMTPTCFRLDHVIFFRYLHRCISWKLENRKKNNCMDTSSDFEPRIN